MSIRRKTKTRKNMSNFLKKDAKTVLSELRKLSGRKLAHFEYMGCCVTSVWISHCTWVTTYKFHWWRIEDRLDIYFELPVRHHSEELIKALELCFDDESSYRYKEEHKIISRYFPTGSIGSVTTSTKIDLELERLANRIVDYSQGLRDRI